MGYDDKGGGVPLDLSLGVANPYQHRSLHLVVWRGVDDGVYAHLQGEDSFRVDLRSSLDDHLHHRCSVECHGATCRGLWMLWRGVEAHAVADIFQESDAATNGFRGLLEVSPR